MRRPARPGARVTLLGLALALAVSACAGSGRGAISNPGSWFMKPGAFAEDQKSRRLLTGVWRADSTDMHAVRRVQETTRSADGTYETHFTEIAESGQVTLEQTECGRWGISGDVYFTITLAIRQGDRGSTVSPYDASFYDAYRIQKLTDTAFVYRHVVSGQGSSEAKLGPAPPRAGPASPGASPCVGLAT